MRAWIFDVDGVLTNLQTRDISQPTILSSLLQILTAHDLLTFNTGRDIAWVQRTILDHLQKMLPDPTLLSHSFIAGEKGGTYQQYGMEEEIATDLIVDQKIVENIKKLIHDEFSDCAFFDEGKKTMVSIEMRRDTSPEVFALRQQELIPALKKLLIESEHPEEFVIDPALIAVDIQSKRAGKDLGVEHILTWVEEHKHQPDMFYCFGDSPTDLHMGTLLQEKNLPFSFIYVGDKPLEPTPFTPVLSEEKFDLGTAQALQELLVS